ncbi:glycosyltransferase family 4 protein [Aquabacterium sp.]|uniref:glycosyltransferase family 4 protein n=1 Tax=Aquabacterium sp. TaxID=1872578 RepID=UPI003D6CBAB1
MAVKVVVAVNSAWNILNFRAGLIKALVSAGYEVVAVAPMDASAQHLPALGCRYVELPMDSQGLNPVVDALLLMRFVRLLRAERPCVYLGYTIKPNIYGSLAARFLGVRVINNIAGLGTVFLRDNWLTKIARLLYWIGLSGSNKVFFQNSEDRAAFLEHGLVPSAKTDLLPGSGVDLKHFAVHPLPHGGHERRSIRFLLVARMIWEKGVGEFVEAARRLRQKWPDAEFCLLGFLEVENPSAISRIQMDAWVEEGVVQYLGAVSDVRQALIDSDCVVLPSYYPEGVPRSLLEAAAMGRPIITTDSAGCRNVVTDGVTGYLTKVRDVDDLVEKMSKLIDIGPSARSEMGRCGRIKIEQAFDERIVIKKYLEALAEMG